MIHKKLTLRTFDSLGCSVAATSVINSLKDKFPNLDLEVYTKYPDLFIDIKGIKIKDISKKDYNIKFDIDLRDYIKTRPHNSIPYKPIYVHMLELAEKNLSIKLKHLLPKINLSKEEINWAINKIKAYKKPLIWIQTETKSQNKNWFDDYWNVLIKELSKNYDIIDLSKTNFTLRQSLAITKVCKGGITLDTFLVHGSAAVGAKNVLVLLGSSRKEVVTYPSQKVIYIKSECPIQPCGMHGYGFGCKKEDEKLFIGHEKTRCIFDDYRCTRIIKPEPVISKFHEMMKE
ncbi:MAG: hypothetical protein AABY32_03575 [Nanoarchaeota archaeon]